MRRAAPAVAVGALGGQRRGPVVRVDSSGGRDVAPRSVGPELPRQDVVGERDVEDLLQPLAQLRIGDWDDRLDAPVEVSRHEVRRSEVVLGPASVAEGEDTGVLEELADDRANPMPFRESGPARTKRAHAADEEVDLSARLRRGVEGVDDLLVVQGVELADVST